MPSHRREAITFYLTISPWLIGFLVFILAPMAIALYLSFARWDLFGAPQWIGLDNYARMARDPLFAQALKVTTIYTLVYVPMEMIGGISLALLVNQKVRGVGVFRTIFYLPSVLAGVAYVVVVDKQQREPPLGAVRIQDHLTVGRLRPGFGGAISTSHQGSRLGEFWN